MRLPVRQLRGLQSQAEMRLADYMGSAEFVEHAMLELPEENDSDDGGSVRSDASNELRTRALVAIQSRSDVIGHLQRLSSKSGRRNSGKNGVVSGGDQRRFRNSWNFVSNSVAKFALPSFSVVCWVFLMFYFVTSYVSTSANVKGYSTMTTQYHLAFLNVRRSLMFALARGSSEDALAQEAAETLMRHDVALERVVRFGGMPSGALNDLPSLGPGVAEHILLLVNGCVAGVDSWDPATLSCETDIRLGASYGAMSFRDRASKLLASVRAAQGSGPCPTPTNGSAAELQSLLKLGADTDTSLRQVAGHFLEDVQLGSDSFVLGFQAATASFSLLFVALLLALAMATISEVKRVLRLTATLVLSLPADIFAAHTKLVQEVSALVKSGTPSSKSKKSSTGGARPL